MDSSRCKLEYETALIEDLAWLGVAFEPNPRRQSGHSADYAAALGELKRQGLAYPCLCSRADVAALSGGARDPDGAPRHFSRACRHQESETARRVDEGERFAWRLDMAAACRIVGDAQTWREFYEGDAAAERSGPALAWGDILLTGIARVASYPLAVVVDDSLQGITDVVRGRDLIEATAAHRVLQRLLGLAPPVYRHHRLVLGGEGAKLGKRVRSPSLAALREAGAGSGDVRRMLGFDGAAADVVFSAGE